MKLVIVLALLLPLAAVAQTPSDPYRAIGTEPFWGLTIDGRTMRLDRPGSAPVTLAAPVPRPTFNGRRYEAATMTVDITAAPCSDGMSDRRYPERVTVTVGAQTLRGCGGDAAGVPVTGQRLEGGSWTIAAIDGQRVALDGARLSFDGATVSGSAGVTASRRRTRSADRCCGSGWCARRGWRALGLRWRRRHACSPRSRSRSGCAGSGATRCCSARGTAGSCFEGWDAPTGAREPSAHAGH